MPAFAAAPSPPLLSYPVEPRAVGGGDPLASVPQPVECHPKLDRPGRRDYTPLSTLQRRQADNPFLVGDQGSVALDYVNRKKQRFRLHLSATTPTMIGRFIATATVCLEAFALKKLPPATIEPVQLAGLLVQAASVGTGDTQASLAAIRDGLVAAGAPATFDDVVAEAGGDPAAVREAAAATAADELAAKVAAGELTAAEVAALDVPAIYARLGALRQAPFLFAPIDTPANATQLSKRVRTDTRGVVVAGAVPLEPLPARLSVILFAFDPSLSIETGKTHHYIAHCRTSAWVRIYSYGGEQKLKFWLQAPYKFIGQRIANAMVFYPPKLAHSSSTKRTHDTSVFANAGGMYSIYGGFPWKQGDKGECPG